FFALVTSIITGIGIDTWLFVLGDVVEPDIWAAKLGFNVLGLFLTCLGISCYLQSTIAPNPLDGAMLVVTRLTGWALPYSRALIAIVLVILAFFMDGAIGLGTVLNALFSGMLIGLFLPRLEVLHQRVQRQLEKVS